VYEELLSPLKAAPTTYLTSMDNSLVAELLTLEEEASRIGLLPPSTSLQSTEATTPSRTASTDTVGTLSDETMSEKENDQLSRAARKKKAMVIALPNENPLNYVAALRIRQDKGRRSSDLFEQLS